MGERGIKVKIIMFKGKVTAIRFLNVSLPNSKAIKIWIEILVYKNLVDDIATNLCSYSVYC